MIDLYRKLGIRKDASLVLINEALRECRNPYIKEEASKILLNKNRKRVYDRCNNALNQISDLRSSLNLTQSSNWLEHRVNYSYQKKTYATNAASKKNNTNPANNGYLAYWIIAFIGLTIFIPILVGIGNDSSNKFYEDQPSNTESEFDVDKFTEDVLEFDKTNKTKENPKSVPKATVSSFKQPEIPLPVHGYTRNFTSREAIAPFRIVPSAYSNHYFIKLENATSGQKEFEFFIRDGKTIEVEVPLGEYVIKYAFGKKWYGVKYLFGPQGGKFKADDIFIFESNAYQISGHSIELIERIGGNLSTTVLDDSEW